MILDNIYIIVAMTRDKRAIGKDGDLLYHLSEDLRYFKKKTLNNVVVIGYNTYMSFPKRPLPNRENIVLSRKIKKIDGALVFDNVNAVLDYASKNKDKKIFISGGQTIYNQFIDYASKMYITIIDKEVEGADTFFSEIDLNKWKKVDEIKGEECKDVDYYFTTWKRIDKI